MFLHSQSGRVFDFCQWLMLHVSQASQEAAILLPFPQDSPSQILAAQRFTTICINLQMWQSSGLEVAVFAFRCHSFMNVSELFQAR